MVHMPEPSEPRQVTVGDDHHITIPELDNRRAYMQFDMGGQTIHPGDVIEYVYVTAEEALKYADTGAPGWWPSLIREHGPAFVDWYVVGRWHGQWDGSIWADGTVTCS